MIIITGPTSSGKTSLAIKMAKKFDADLISADSRQIYKYMDVGTGKKPIDLTESQYKKGDKFWQIEGVKIHMYDVILPNEEYSSFQYVAEASKVIQKIKTSIVVGGTGFYIDSLTTNTSDFPVSVDIDMRDSLSKKSLEELTKIIPHDYLNTWNNSEKNNPNRLIRAIQIHEVIGEWPLKSKKTMDPSERNLFVELTAPREFLYNRVDDWAEKIWSPLLEEVENIKELGYLNAAPMNGIIYKTAKQYLRGEIHKEEAIEQIKFDLHSYIRRQQTWFKRYKHSIKVDMSESSFDRELFPLVESYLVNQKHE